MAAMDTAGLAKLQKPLLDVLAREPPLTTSVAGRWLVYGIVYEIDDTLGTLEYSGA